MGKEVYAIKKTLINANGKKIHILLTDGHSVILETKNKNVVDKMVEVLNANTDNGCSYEVITIGSSENT